MRLSTSCFESAAANTNPANSNASTGSAKPTSAPPSVGYTPKTVNSAGIHSAVTGSGSASVTHRIAANAPVAST